MNILTRSALSLAIALAIIPSAQATNNFSVYRATVALPVNYNATDRNFDQVIVRRTLTNRALINLALGRPSADKPAKNVIIALAGPGNFSFSVTPTAPAQLIVWDTNTQTKLATIATFGTRQVLEQTSKAYRRVGVGPMTFLAGGSPANRITSGALTVQGTLTKKSTPRGPSPSVKTSGTGTIALVIDSLSIPLGIVQKASIVTSGLPIGTFAE